MSLNLYGWDDIRNQEIMDLEITGLVPGRVISSSRGIYSVVIPSGEARAELSGGFRYRTVSNLDYPVVGDFVFLREEPGLYIIEQILNLL